MKVFYICEQKKCPIEPYNITIFFEYPNYFMTIIFNSNQLYEDDLKDLLTQPYGHINIGEWRINYSIRNKEKYVMFMKFPDLVYFSVKFDEISEVFLSLYQRIVI